MAEAKFDPYHAWLGIPAWDRPVNAYRLLGLEVFEENRKVIEAAANRQMAYLQELSSGDEHIEEAQKLLGLVSRARVLLLNPGKKAAYDKKLIAQLDSLPEATSDSSQTTKIPTHSSAAVTLAKKERNLNQVTALRTALLLLAGIIMIFAFWVFFTPKQGTVTVWQESKDQQFADKVVLEVTKGSKPIELLETENGVAYLPITLDGQFTVTVIDRYYEAVEKTNQTIALGNPSLTAPSLEIEVRHKKKRVEPQKKSVVAPLPQKSIKIKGEILAPGEDGKKQPVDRQIVYVDADDNDIFLRSDEKAARSNPSGKFELRCDLEEGKTVPLRLYNIPEYYLDPGPLVLSLADAEDGVINQTFDLQYKPLIISGTVKVLPKKDSSEKLIIYYDRNENDQLDKEEPQIETDDQNSYQFEIPVLTIIDIENALKRLRFQPPEGDDYNIPISRFRNFKQSNAISTIAITNADFLITKKELPGEQNNTVATEEKNAEPKPNPPPIIPTPESDAAGFLRNLGFEGKEPQEGSDTKPEWTFQTDPSALVAFTNAKRDYDKAAKKQNWNKIPKLNSDIQNIDGQIEEILTGAKTEAQTKRAQQQVQPFNAAREQLNAELNQLKQSRNALLTPLVMAAEAIGEEQEMYNESVVKQEQVKKAEENLGVSVQPLTKKQNAAWQPALKFLAEDKLRSLGLQKQGRKWTPTGVAQAADLFVTLKQYLSKHFSEYVKLKQQVNALISQNAVANQSKIEKLQHQITNQTGWKTYRDAKKEFNSGVKKYMALLNKLQSQREELENNKEAIEKALTLLGGKYKVVINQYPSTEQIEQKKALIAKWQSLIE